MPAARARAIAAALVLAAITSGAVGCGGGGDDGQSVQVDALWYGTTADGEVTGGVTPVDITAVEDDPDPLLSLIHI